MPGTSGTPGTNGYPVVWFEVVGRDVDALRSFYGSLLGWRFQLDPMSKMGIVQKDAGGKGISGSVHKASPGQPRWLTMYAQVPDVHVAVEKAQALGSQIMLTPTRLPDVTIAVVTDPEGHPLGLCTPHDA